MTDIDMSTCSQPLNDHVFLGRGGEMGQLIREYDWKTTPIGTPDTWPQSLRTAIRLMLSSRHPMFIWWGPQLIQFYNDAYRETMGPEMHPSALGGPGRDSWAEIWSFIGPQIEMVMAGEGATWQVEQLVPIRRHGALQEVWWTYGFSPIDDGDEVGGVFVVCNDVTDEYLTRLALTKANARLSGEMERLRGLFSQAPGFVAVLKGPDYIFEFTNAAYERLVGRTDIVGKTLLDIVPEVEGQGFLELMNAVYATGEAHVGTGVLLALQREEGAPLEQVYIDFVYQPIRDAKDEVTGIFVEGYDVTARVAAEDRQRMMVDEMNHRVKNTLATVQSLTMLTSRSAKTVEEFKEKFADRIRSMALTHDLILRGKDRPVQVREILEVELSPYLGAGDQVQFHCDPMTVSPRNAVSLGLLVHELLTNAAKYGGLSGPGGRLHVYCERKDNRAVIAWREEIQIAPPIESARGFGTKLIERLARDLGGKARMKITAEGLDANITFDLEGDGPG